MKIPFICSVLVSGWACGQTVLFSDTFDAPDAIDFDTSDLTGRLSGTLASEVILQSWGRRQKISGNQALLGAGPSGLRFENTNGIAGPANRFDWASGQAGAAILAGDGFTVSFDWTPPAVDGNRWISFQVGTVNGDTNAVGTGDYSVFFRQSGGSGRYDDDVFIGVGSAFTPTVGPRNVVIKFELTSFADGEVVTATSSVDGTQVAVDTFTWNGNLGEMRMELGNNDTGQLIDNFTVTTNSSPTYLFALDTTTFSSSQTTGSFIGILSAEDLGTPVDSTFTLVAGEGDTDNDKFQITGNSLEVGSFDFMDGGSIDGQQFAIRIQATDNSGPDFLETSYILTIIKDDDGDDLIDDWELRWADDLEELSGISGDADADGLTDLLEFQVSQGLEAGVPAYSDLDPTKSDTDGDELSDTVEIYPRNGRAQTNPTLADTDLDGLSDLIENNSGIFEGMNATGTSPLLIDTDLDGSRDMWEILRSTDPIDIDSYPPSDSPQVTLVQLTDDASSDISSAKTYTHAISGGEAATVNEVAFEALTPALAPLDFQWDTGAFSKSLVVNQNGDWLPTEGGVTGPGLLELLGDCTFSENGANAGASQTYILSGLTPGISYDLRLYIRLWDSEGSGRSIDLAFTNGDEVTVPFGAIPEDRPGLVLQTGNDQNAYYLSYQYTAQTSEVQVTASLHPGLVGESGSFHMFGLTNEITTLSTPVISSAGFSQNGSYVILFSGPPSRTFEVTKSLDLTSGFISMSPSIQVTTDPTGMGQAIIPPFQASDAKVFFRLEPAP